MISRHTELAHGLIPDEDLDTRGAIERWANHRRNIKEKLLRVRIVCTRGKFEARWDIVSGDVNVAGPFPSLIHATGWLTVNGYEPDEGKDCWVK